MTDHGGLRKTSALRTQDGPWSLVSPDLFVFDLSSSDPGLLPADADGRDPARHGRGQPNRSRSDMASGAIIVTPAAAAETGHLLSEITTSTRLTALGGAVGSGTEAAASLTARDAPVSILSMSTWSIAAVEPAVLAVTAEPTSPSVARHIVFIDGAVTNAATLAQGVETGVEAVILPADRDGVAAIADWLAIHQAHDLSSISIVAHGANGVLRLGSVALESDTIGRYQTALARLGSALAPDGDILLYACDVAQDANGVAFIERLSAATGVANIAASSHVVGSAEVGGDFILDVNYGFVDSSIPFTPLAQASVDEALLTAINALYYTTTGAPTTSFAANRVAQIGVSGTIQTGGSITLRDATQEAIWDNVPAVTADPATGKYFIIDSKAVAVARILSGSITSPGALTLVTSYAASTYRPLDITIDQPSQTLYFTLAPTQLSTPASSVGVWKMKEDGTGLTQVIGGYTTVSATTVPKALALDLANNLIFFTEGGSVAGTSRVLVGNSLGGTKSAALISHNIGTLISDVLVHNGTLYYSTVNGGTVSSNNIFAVPYTVSGVGAAATAVLGAVSTLYAGANAGNPVSIAIDPATGRLYTAGSIPVGGSFGTVAINVGTIAGGGSIQQLFTQSNGTQGVNGNGLFFQSAPTVTATGTVTHVVGGPAVTVAPLANVISPSGFTLKSAKVEITGGNFIGDGDTLTAITAGTSISASFSGDLLTLTGIDTAAHYKQVLDSVAYKSTAADPTNGAANRTRTLTWTVSDGVISSGSPVTTVNIHGLPTIVAGGTATFLGGGSPVTLASGVTVSNPYSTTLSSATLSITGFIGGDVLNFVNQGGVVGNYITSTGTLSLSGVASLATYQTALRSITYSYSPGNGDPTGGGSKTSRTINWTVNDGVTSSAAATSALNTVHVAPTIVTSGTITYGIGHPPAALDPALTVIAPNSFGLLAGATVTIAGGSFVGEADILTATTIGTSISFNYNTTTDIATLSGSDTVANYLSVLRSITISSVPDPSNGGANKSRTISWTINDGVANSATSTSFAEAVPCFAEGTRIMTVRGEVPVQALRAGDTVLTRTGVARPIRWVGHRHLDLTRHPDPSRVRPIRILADAIAPGVPVRDVHLSPDHAIWMNGMLVPAQLLRNDCTVIQDSARRSVTYYHVELETHDVLLADGLPAESYLDTGNRDLFANGGAVMRLHPDLLDLDDGQALRIAASCAPFALDPGDTAPLWKALADRAAGLGHTICVPSDTDDDPDLHVLVGERHLRPVSCDNGCHVFVLPASARSIRLASRAAVPSKRWPWIEDRRSLGVMVAALTLRYRDGFVQVIPLDHPGLDDGWWAAEWHAPTVLRRWTNGLATVSVDGLAGAMLEVVLARPADPAIRAAA